MKYRVTITAWNNNNQNYYLTLPNLYCSIQAAQKAVGVKKFDINSIDTNIKFNNSKIEIIRILNYDSFPIT